MSLLCQLTAVHYVGYGFLVKRRDLRMVVKSQFSKTSYIGQSTRSVDDKMIAEAL